MKTGLYIGRFQPFHNGHLSAVKQALREVDFLYIGIGSAQYSHTPENPFTAEERQKMIQDALTENGIKEKQFKTIHVPDIHSNPKWTAHVHSLIPHFDMVFVGDDGLVKKLFEKYDTVPVKIVKKEINISATKIREGIMKNGDWKKYLSKSAIGYLEKIETVKRIRT